MPHKWLPEDFSCCCNAQATNAVKDQQAANAELAEMKAKGQVPTADGGWTMTATINGKPWKASSMFPPQLSGRIIGYYQESSIGLPFNRGRLNTGNKETLKQDDAADLRFDLSGDEDDLWGGYVGEIEITKVTGIWAEGKFYFTASQRSSGKKVEVTNGFFRIQVR